MGFPTLAFSCSEQCRRVLEGSYAKAREEKREYIGSAELLFALVEEPTQIVERLLRDFRPALDQGLADAYRHDAPTPTPLFPDLLPTSPRVHMALEHAERFRAEFKMSHVEPEHVLLGLLMESDCEAADLFSKVGVNLDAVGRCLVQLYRGGE